MLITAALYGGTTHHLNIAVVAAVAAAAAIVGDNIGTHSAEPVGSA